MSSTMAWTLLFIAGLFEVVWVVSLRYSEGFTKIIPSAVTVISLAISMYLLARVSQTLPLGTAYGIWVGIGAFGAAVAGAVLFNEPTSLLRHVFLALLLVSIVGLKVTTKV